MRSLSTDDFKFKHTRPASNHGFAGKEKLLTTGKQLPGHVSNLEKACPVNVVVVDGSDTSTGNASLEHSRQ